MKRVLFVGLLLSFWTGAALAQSSNGYLFFGPGAVTACGMSSGAFYFGGGGEGILGKIVGLGGELGAVTSTHFRGTLGLADANGYVHFTASRRPRFDPFVTGGYSLLFHSGHANLFNVGGGLNYWFGKSLGLRLEFRDHIWRESSVTAHYLGLRAGICFRSGRD